MRLLKKSVFNLSFLFVFSALLVIASCREKITIDENKPPVPTTPQARKLVDSTCHFISKERIAQYVARYEQWKKLYGSDLLPKGGQKSVFTDSSSFNSNIVRAILADKRCIGLRVIYGIGPDNMLHVILVGIAPDYSTLYIRRPAEKCYPKKTMALPKDSSIAPAGDEEDEFGSGEGGAEMGQLP